MNYELDLYATEWFYVVGIVCLHIAGRQYPVTGHRGIPPPTRCRKTRAMLSSIGAIGRHVEEASPRTSVRGWLERVDVTFSGVP